MGSIWQVALETQLFDFGTWTLKHHCEPGRCEAYVLLPPGDIIWMPEIMPLDLRTQLGLNQIRNIVKLSLILSSIEMFQHLVQL